MYSGLLAWAGMALPSEVLLELTGMNPTESLESMNVLTGLLNHTLTWPTLENTQVPLTSSRKKSQDTLPPTKEHYSSNIIESSHYFMRNLTPIMVIESQAFIFG